MPDSDKIVRHKGTAARWNKTAHSYFRRSFRVGPRVHTLKKSSGDGWLLEQQCLEWVCIMSHLIGASSLFSGVNLCMGSISLLPCMRTYTLPYTHIAFTWLLTVSIRFGKYYIELVFENVPYLLWFDFESTLFCLVGFFLLVVEMNHILGIPGKCTHYQTSIPACLFLQVTG